MLKLPVVNTRDWIQEALAQKLDPHTYVAAKLQGCAMEEVTSAARQRAKALNFVHMYTYQGIVSHGKTS